jgi:transporter family-2 protein
VTAGSAALILGQLLISMVVDSMGWTGQEVVPITWQRVLGLIVMAGGLFLLMPKNR